MISDAVLIALITAFVTMFGVAVGAYVSIRGMIKENTKTTVSNSRKIDESRAETAEVKQIAERTSNEVKQMTTGAFNAGVLRGVALERIKNSDLGTLE